VTRAGADVASTRDDASRERRSIARKNPDWSLEGTISAVSRFVCSIVGHVDDGAGSLADLYALVRLRDRLDQAIDTAARHLLEHDDASYREVGAALGMTRQAAASRYPSSSSRRPGGQPSRLR
jgi:hypothetical protein